MSRRSSSSRAYRPWEKSSQMGKKDLSSGRPERRDKCSPYLPRLNRDPVLEILEYVAEELFFLYRCAGGTTHGFFNGAVAGEINNVKGIDPFLRLAADLVVPVPHYPDIHHGKPVTTVFV